MRTCGDASQELCKPSVVFDVDDTLLDADDLYSQANFDMPYAQWLTHSEECAWPAIAPTRDLFNTAKKLGASVFIITGGKDAQRPEIIACFRTRGITGFRIGFAIGDQISDSAGGHTAQGFLLPNPMYFIPSLSKPVAPIHSRMWLGADKRTHGRHRRSPTGLPLADRAAAEHWILHQQRLRR